MELPIKETEILMIELAIFVFCLIAAAIEHLVDNGMLEIDEE